jgi:hypothetical protein
MNDEFQFGERAKHPARLGAAAAPRSRRSIDLRLVWMGAGLLAAGAVAFAFLRGADEAGNTLADARSETVAQVDRAHDAAAQGTMGRAVVVAQSLYAEHGSFTSDRATLSAYDPELHFTSGPSNGPTAISYAVEGSGFGAAVRSASGTCWWVKIDASGVTAYGSGAPCTGSAAMASSSVSW